jgi:RNA polymerase sigma factor (sigma-70 family)
MRLFHSRSAINLEKRSAKGNLKRYEEMKLWESESGRSLLAKAKNINFGNCTNSGKEEPLSADERKAASKLIELNEGLNRRLASGYWRDCRNKRWCRAEIDYDELQQAGRMGQFKSMDRYEPAREYLFSSYAIFQMMKFMAGLCKRSIKRSEKRVDPYQKNPIDTESDDLFSRVADSGSLEAHDRIEFEGRKAKIRGLLDLLNSIEKAIICKRLGLGEPEMTLKEIGDEYNLSRERIRQIEARAKRKMRAWAVDLGLDEAA